MDPIHPLVPQSPTLPPVAPATRAAGVNRDGGRSGADQERRRRQPGSNPQQPPTDELGLDPSDDGDDPRPHVDITA